MRSPEIFSNLDLNRLKLLEIVGKPRFTGKHSILTATFRSTIEHPLYVQLLNEVKDAVQLYIVGYIQSPTYYHVRNIWSILNEDLSSNFSKREKNK